MNNFIEVTLINGDNQLINVQYIISVNSTPNRTDGAKSKIIVQTIGEIWVREPYDRISNLICGTRKKLVE